MFGNRKLEGLPFHVV